MLFNILEKGTLLSTTKRKSSFVHYWIIDIDEVLVYRTYQILQWRLDMEAYCMKCRTKREMKDAKGITMKNGKPATQGVCPSCGTKMFRIGKG